MSTRRVVGISMAQEEAHRLDELLQHLPYVTASKLALEAFRLGLPLLEAKHLPKHHAGRSEKKAA